jgi:hypothetical protein
MKTPRLALSAPAQTLRQKTSPVPPISATSLPLASTISSEFTTTFRARRRPGLLKERTALSSLDTCFCKAATCFLRDLISADDDGVVFPFMNDASP